MTGNSGIVDVQIAGGEQESQQDWIDVALATNARSFPGRPALSRVASSIFQVVDSISGGLRKIFVARNQIKKTYCEVGHIDLTKM